MRMDRFWICFIVAILLVSQGFAQNGISLPERPQRPAYIDYSEREHGFWCTVEVEAGTSVDVQAKNMQVIAGHFIGGYRFSEYLRVGIGLGGRRYLNNQHDRRSKDVSSFTLPLFVDARGNFISQADRDLVPYWSFDVGGMVWDGFFFSPTVGLRFGEARNSWLLGLGYSLNVIRVAPEKKKEANFLMLKIGYEF